jgi:hypothetical protein
MSYLVSYDGRTGGKTHGRRLPPSLGLQLVELDAGRSSQSTLLGRAEKTVESLYLSPALVERLNSHRAIGVTGKRAFPNGRVRLRRTLTNALRHPLQISEKVTARRSLALPSGKRPERRDPGMTIPMQLQFPTPRTEREYCQLVKQLDRLIDEVGEDENHQLASMMEALGVLIERYEHKHVAELA